nr:unnamed protein product [Callosobruchus chinensis]
MPKNSYWQDASNLVKLFNDWFDLMNSRSKFTANCPKRNAYGIDLDIQLKLINEVSELVNTMRVGEHKSLISFQKGILLTNKSIIELYSYLKETYNVEYVLTSRLNQDVLENFFSYIRGVGGANDHPSPLEFKHRLRWYILGNNSAAVFTENRNTVESHEQCLLKVLSESETVAEKDTAGSSSTPEDTCLTQDMLSNLTTNVQFSEETHAEEESLLDMPCFVTQDAEDLIDEEMYSLMNDFQIKEKISEESLKYVAGFVGYKFKNKYNLGTPTSILDTQNAPDWLQTISTGFLLQPNDELWNVALKLETEFYKLHGTGLNKEKHIFKKLTENTMSQLETCAF